MHGAPNRALFDNKQHLACQIDLERASEPTPGLRLSRVPERPACPRPDDAVAGYLLPALKGDHGMPRLVAEDAVDLATLQVAQRDEPPLYRRDRAATVAVAQITRSGHARQRKQDDKWSQKHAAARSLDAATRVGARARQQLLLAYACSPSCDPMTVPVLRSPRPSCPAAQTVRLCAALRQARKSGGAASTSDRFGGVRVAEAVELVGPVGLSFRLDHSFTTKPVG